MVRNIRAIRYLKVSVFLINLWGCWSEAWRPLHQPGCRARCCARDQESNSCISRTSVAALLRMNVKAQSKPTFPGPALWQGAFEAAWVQRKRASRALWCLRRLLLVLALRQQRYTSLTHQHGLESLLLRCRVAQLWWQPAATGDCAPEQALQALRRHWPSVWFQPRREMLASCLDMRFELVDVALRSFDDCAGVSNFALCGPSWGDNDHKYCTVDDDFTRHPGRYVPACPRSTFYSVLLRKDISTGRKGSKDPRPLGSSAILGQAARIRSASKSSWKPEPQAVPPRATVVVTLGRGGFTVSCDPNLVGAATWHSSPKGLE